jgi:hypothetical protein
MDWNSSLPRSSRIEPPRSLGMASRYPFHPWSTPMTFLFVGSVFGGFEGAPFFCNWSSALYFMEIVFCILIEGAPIECNENSFPKWITSQAPRSVRFSFIPVMELAPTCAPKTLSLVYLPRRPSVWISYQASAADSATNSLFWCIGKRWILI